MTKLTEFDLAELARVGIDPRDHEAAEEHLAWLGEKLEAARAPFDDDGYLASLDDDALSGWLAALNSDGDAPMRLLPPERRQLSGALEELARRRAKPVAPPRFDELLSEARDWVVWASHDERCFTNDPNPAACRCICGKDSLIAHIDDFFEATTGAYHARVRS